MTSPWLSSSPLNLRGRLDPLPHGFKDCLPIFTGTGARTAEEHLVDFATACWVLGVTSENVAVRLFALSLEEFAQRWFRSLDPGSMTSWTEMMEAFKTKYTLY
ncbi:hypothetical protein KI387_030739, partial [Taxus chinensis]